MNKIIRNFGSATLLGMLLITANTTLNAQTAGEATTTVQTTTSAGTISEFGPKTIFIRTEASPEPIRYSYTKTTTYVDEAGNPVSMALVKSGLPVTVYYVKDGTNMVASKVIVRKAVSVAPATTEVVVPAAPVVEEKKTTTTTTTDSEK